MVSISLKNNEKLKNFTKDFLNFIKNKGIIIFAWFFSLCVLLSIFNNVNNVDIKKDQEIARLREQNTTLQLELKALQVLKNTDEKNYRDQIDAMSKRWCIG